MNVVFVSSSARGRHDYHGYQIHRARDSVNITVPSELVLRLLPERDILQNKLEHCQVPDQTLPGFCQGQILAGPLG